MTEPTSLHSTVLVTGAASGIGRAVAVRIAAEGYRLALFDQDAAGLEATHALLAGEGHIALEGDVTILADLERAVAEQADSAYPLQGVVANAGIEVLGDVLALTTTDWDRSLAVNLTGTFNTAKACLPSLIKQGGSFVAVSSDAGVVGAQGYAAYSAAKHGLIGLVKSMALDYGQRGIRTNAVAPSFVETAMADRIFESDPASQTYYAGTVPLGRFARADEIASAVFHLLSDESSYVNGMVYRIDGGSTAGYFEKSE